VDTDEWRALKLKARVRRVSVRRARVCGVCDCEWSVGAPQDQLFDEYARRGERSVGDEERLETPTVYMPSRKWPASGGVIFCLVIFCFVLFCFVLFCFVLFCFVLFCFVLFCLK
jgi:hypothetical protein